MTLGERVRRTRRAPDYDLAGFWLHLVNVLILAHHAFSVAAGVVGFVFEPSPAVARIIGGEIATYLWSGLFVVSGASALWARLWRRVRAEMVAIVVIGLARLLWTTMIVIGAIVNADPAGLQSGIALGGGGLYMLGWAIYAAHWVQTGRVAVAIQQDQKIILNHLTTELRKIADEQEAD